MNNDIYLTVPDEPALGDISREAFLELGHEMVEWIGEYLEHSSRYPVLSRVKPGAIRDALPADAPSHGQALAEIFGDFEKVILPGITHWNHPRFFGYFAISGSGPGVLGEFLTAALNVQAMLWRTSPAATELEEVVLGWLRRLLGLPEDFEGVIYDTASIASLHALAAAREAQRDLEIRERGLAARPEVPALRVYCSQETHSSIDKAVILLGLGLSSLRKIPVNPDFQMDVQALRAAVQEDRATGWRPCAVVATVGTTSTTSVDPVSAIAEICRDEALWLHVDAAYAGVAALVPELRTTLDGCHLADSLVVNPHKWLFTPFDLSAFYCRRMDALRRACSLTPEYLTTPDSGRNLMDTGVQLGRRFRALKLWMVLRAFGADGLRSRLREHVRLAQLLARLVDDDPDFERLAPVPFSVVCFRANPRSRRVHDLPAAARSGEDEEALDRLNDQLMTAVNETGEIFISHTRIHGRMALRLAIGHIRTTEADVMHAWNLLKRKLVSLSECQVLP